MDKNKIDDIKKTLTSEQNSYITHLLKIKNDEVVASYSKKIESLKSEIENLKLEHAKVSENANNYEKLKIEVTAKENKAKFEENFEKIIGKNVDLMNIASKNIDFSKNIDEKELEKELEPYKKLANNIGVGVDEKKVAQKQEKTEFRKLLEKKLI